MMSRFYMASAVEVVVVLKLVVVCCCSWRSRGVSMAGSLRPKKRWLPWYVASRDNDSAEVGKGGGVGGQPCSYPRPRCGEGKQGSGGGGLTPL
jgi:hypothetical protein